MKIKEFAGISVFTCMMTASVDIDDKGSCYSNTKNQTSHNDHTDLPCSVVLLSQVTPTAYGTSLLSKHTDEIHVSSASLNS